MGLIMIVILTSFIIAEKFLCTKIPEQRISYRTVALGIDAAQAGVTIPPTSELEAALAPTTSHLEGVGNHWAAHAATGFIH